MCVHTLVHPHCQTCRTPIEPPTPGTRVEITYCAGSWTRLLRLRAAQPPPPSPLSPPPPSPTHLFELLAAPRPKPKQKKPAFAPPSHPDPSWPPNTPVYGVSPSSPKAGPTASLACRFLPPPSSSSSPLPPLPYITTSTTTTTSTAKQHQGRETEEEQEREEDTSFELAFPRVPTCHRCDPRRYGAGSGSGAGGGGGGGGGWGGWRIFAEAQEWLVYEQAQPARYARMCEWVCPGDDDGHPGGSGSGSGIVQRYEWAMMLHAADFYHIAKQ
ncbi:hypothetical protein F5X99DRAFT_405544 [Biscogniauxia marginata]|nr:hypothetical protein F5X99DRAFT_405544 [Biscogniauxia marginata]